MASRGSRRCSLKCVSGAVRRRPRLGREGRDRLGFLRSPLAIELVGNCGGVLHHRARDGLDDPLGSRPADRSGARSRRSARRKNCSKTCGLQGLEEATLRQFVCKYSGRRWEEFFEALFGYDAKVAAREWSRAELGRSREKFAAWREPIIAWIDARQQVRKAARERKLLQAVEVKAAPGGRHERGRGGGESGTNRVGNRASGGGARGRSAIAGALDWYDAYATLCAFMPTASRTSPIVFRASARARSAP